MVSFLDLPKLPPLIYGVDTYPLFTRISIETTKVCTRTCWFCCSENRGKHQETMSDGMYSKIVEELSDLQFDGVCQWFFLNEPLFDKNWEPRIAFLREQVPRCTIHITTNWDTMHRKPRDVQVDTITRLYEAGVNSLNLNDYDNRGYKSLVEDYSTQSGIPLVHHCWQRIGPRKRVISCGPLPEKLHSWTDYIDTGDLEDHSMPTQGGKGRCPRPMRHLVVQWDGSVPLCCARDTTRPDTEIYGNVATSTLTEIWNSKGLWEYRRRLQDGERTGQCTGCTAKVAYPHVVRKVEL
jgi:MoaA/NifB/PqqE/SkfB family radical SAM enzyme